MADETEEEEEEGGGGKKKIIMIVGVLAAAGAAYKFVLAPSPPPDELADTTEPVVEEIVEGEIVELDEMILNIGGTTDPAFLRVGVALVLDDVTLAADFEPETAIAKDVIIQYMSSVNQDQLRTSEGQELAKEQLGAMIRTAYGEEKVVRILFTALVMQ